MIVEELMIMNDELKILEAEYLFDKNMISDDMFFVENSNYVELLLEFAKFKKICKQYEKDYKKFVKCKFKKGVLDGHSK